MRHSLIQPLKSTPSFANFANRLAQVSNAAIPLLDRRQYLTLRRKCTVQKHLCYDHVGRWDRLVRKVLRELTFRIPKIAATITKWSPQKSLKPNASDRNFRRMFVF